jgi:hypothetical protein
LSEIFTEVPAVQGGRPALGQVFHAEWAAARRRFLLDWSAWDSLSPVERASIEDGARAVAAHVASPAAEDYDRAAEESARRSAPELGARYALVEQLGHRAMVGVTREITFCGKTMLEVQRIDVVPSVTVRVNPDTFYGVTDLSPEQAVAMARAYGRSTGGLDLAGVVTRAISEHRQRTAGSSPWHEDNPDDEDVDESARELAAEGNAVAMSDTERDEYDRDGEALLDAQEEAAELASVDVGDDL